MERQFVDIGQHTHFFASGGPKRHKRTFKQLLARQRRLNKMHRVVSVKLGRRQKRRRSAFGYSKKKEYSYYTTEARVHATF